MATPADRVLAWAASRRHLAGPGGDQPRLTDGVVDPFVRAQLDQQKGGAALGGLLLTWWLGGRLFAATSRASTPPTTSSASGCRSASG